MKKTVPLLEMGGFIFLDAGSWMLDAGCVGLGSKSLRGATKQPPP
jgi:hypothetical protein